MPIFEYRCSDCRRRFSLLVGVVAAGPDARCPRCGSEQIARRISRFAVARSEEDALDDMADKVGDLEDPRQMADWMKKMGREMGEDLGDDFEELAEEAAREESEGGGSEDDGDDDL